MRKTMTCAASLALLVFAFSPPAGAQGWSTSRLDNLTYLTFSGPVALPGTTLPAGTYVFRVPDARYAWRIVQVLNSDMSVVYATLMTIPQSRDAEGRDVIFMESEAGTPPRIHAWYPGHRFNGHEFLYPKESEPDGTIVDK